jgi:sulfate-transporting ATPase
VRFLGARTTAPLHVRARKGLGVVSQERAVLMDLTVRENLRVSRCEIDRALELFPELESHVERRVGLLSGGQQQMLALARCLARQCRLLLVDELSLGLAPLVVDRLLRSVRAAADQGTAVLLVEQHIHKALSVADRVLVMARGTIALEGKASDLRSRLDDIQDAYLRTSASPAMNGANETPGRD